MCRKFTPLAVSDIFELTYHLTYKMSEMELASDSYQYKLFSNLLKLGLFLLAAFSSLNAIRAHKVATWQGHTEKENLCICENMKW